MENILYARKIKNQSASLFYLKKTFSPSQKLNLVALFKIVSYQEVVALTNKNYLIEKLNQVKLKKSSLNYLALKIRLTRKNSFVDFKIDTAKLDLNIHSKTTLNDQHYTPHHP